VGYRTTFRLLNNLWAAHYAYRAGSMQLPVEPGVTFVLTRAGGRDAQAHAMKMQRMEECMRIVGGVAGSMPRGSKCGNSDGAVSHGGGSVVDGGGDGTGTTSAALEVSRGRATRAKAEATNVAGGIGAISETNAQENHHMSGEGGSGSGSDGDGSTMEWSAISGFNRQRSMLGQSRNRGGDSTIPGKISDGDSDLAGREGTNTTAATVAAPADDEWGLDNEGGFANSTARFHTALLSSRVVSSARRLLVDYRIGMCRAGHGPYSGGSTPSSGQGPYRREHPPVTTVSLAHPPL